MRVQQIAVDAVGQYFYRRILGIGYFQVIAGSCEHFCSG